MLLVIVGTTAMPIGVCLLHLEASSPSFFMRARKTLARRCICALVHPNPSKPIQIWLVVEPPL